MCRRLSLLLLEAARMLRLCACRPLSRSRRQLLRRLLRVLLRHGMALWRWRWRRSIRRLLPLPLLPGCWLRDALLFGCR